MSITALPEFVARATEQARSLLGQVAGVDNVLEGDPQAPDWPAYLEAFRRDDGVIHGWVVFPEVREERSATREDHVQLRFLLRGFRSVELDKGSREAFRATVGRVIDAFRTSTLNGAVELVDPIQSLLARGALAEERTFGDVLVHVAELELTAHEWLDF